ncbi:MAG: hypothetical protein QF876_04715 [Desulfobacterales bacterium]|jgi:hypothetical protein|nr:hypothetical protein [Desulfobacterales bacterium]MDP6807136.1 hypothetical protein [Desulfobacterales bacterium]|tara:strand:- start:10334 stop:10972 length:639 start_codon:yes stop_codon:yes gene_type:complete
MIQETMSRQERFAAAVSLEKPDRVPVMPLMTAFAVCSQGITQGTAWRDPDMGFKAMLDTFNDLGGFDRLYKPNLFWPMIGGRFCSTPIRVLIPGRQLPEDALNQIDERELISRDDYDKLAVLGWNAFWDEHYEKMTGGRKISYVTATQNQLLDLYKEEVTIYHGQDIHPLFGAYVSHPGKGIRALHLTTDRRPCPNKAGVCYPRLWPFYHPS